MNRPQWSLVIFSPSSPMRSSRRVVLPRLTVAAIAIFVVFGGFGLARTAHFLGSYAFSVLGLNAERFKKAQLVQSLDFLEQLSETQSEKIRHLIDAEDQTRLRFGLSTVSDDVRKVGIGGAPTVEEVVVASLTNPVLMKADTLRQTFASLLRQAKLQKLTFGTLEDYVSREHSQWSRHPSVWPARGRLASGFGMRMHPTFGEKMFHEGIDISGEAWSPIHATADGVVKFAGVQSDYGLMVIVDHDGNGYETAYAHLKQAAAVEGDIVKRGQLIGYMGSSGRSTGTHVHYEVRFQGNVVNPAQFILPDDVVVN